MLEGLFVKTMALLTLNMAGGALGCVIGKSLIRNPIAWIVCVILYFVGAFMVFPIAAANPLAGVITMGIWSVLSGLVIAPAIDHYVKKLGWHQVALAFAGTGGTMAICGIVGALSGINFSGLGSILGFALIGLILFGLVGLFIRVGRQARIVESIIGMIVFAGYFIFDFFRLSKSQDTWFNAIELSMNLYLDFLNFLLYLLQLMEKSRESASLDTLNDTAMAFVTHGQTFLMAAGIC